MVMKKETSAEWAGPRGLLAVQLNSQHQDVIQRQSVGMSIAVHSWENKTSSAGAITQTKHHLSHQPQQPRLSLVSPKPQAGFQCHPPVTPAGHVGGSSTCLRDVLRKLVTSWFSQLQLQKSTVLCVSPGAGWVGDLGLRLTGWPWLGHCSS